VVQKELAIYTTQTGAQNTVLTVTCDRGGVGWLI